MFETTKSIKIRRYPRRIVIEVERPAWNSTPINLLAYRQFTQWHQIIVDGPTTNCVGTRGNDFPGIYYYNPSTEQQWVVMVEGPVDWRECSLDALPANGVLELGLFSTGKIDKNVSLRAWHSAQRDTPDQWQALETLVTKSFTLLPLPSLPDPAPDWTDLALRCLKALKSDNLQHPLARSLGGIAFHSMWDQYHDFYSRPNPYIELICQASIARAVHNAAEHMLIKDDTLISQKLTQQVIPSFFNGELGIFENSFLGTSSSDPAQRKQLVVDTWYALSNLNDVLYLSAAFPRQRLLRKLAQQAITTWLTIAREIGHIFPLFLNVATRQGQGGKLNIAAGGLYARVMLSAASLFPRRAEEMKAEAATALNVMRRFPIQQMFHQPELLARAAESAMLLSIDDSSYKEVARGFIHALLLMMYRDPVNSGLFQGCAGMMYPTFRESVATLTALAVLDNSMPDLPLKSICDLGLSRCYRFLKHYSDGAVLPSEGLATMEMPGAGSIGTAVYAAGGIFDLAYMQTALR